MQSGWSQNDISRVLVCLPPTCANAAAASIHGGASAMPAGEHDDGRRILDKKTETLIWSVVGYCIRSIIGGLAASIAAYMFFTVSVYGVTLYHPGFYFNFGDVIVNSIIGGLIFGFILAKFYPKLRKLAINILATGFIIFTG